MVGGVPEFLAFAVGNFSASLDGLAAHLFGKVRTGTSEAGVIGEVGNFGESATDTGTFKNLGLDASARRVESSGEGSRTAADDSEVENGGRLGGGRGGC